MDGVPAGDPAGVGAAARLRAVPRNGSSETVECAHMLCRQPATALLLFDPRVATAWLVDAAGSAPSGLPMCTARADRFRPPVGWVLSDQRTPVERTEPADASGPAGPEAPQSGADAAGGAPGSATGDDSPAVAEPIPTPLLSRAFRTTAQVLT